MYYPLPLSVNLFFSPLIISFFFFQFAENAQNPIFFQFGMAFEQKLSEIFHCFSNLIWKWREHKKNTNQATLLFTPFCRFGMCVMQKIEYSDVNGAVMPLFQRSVIKIVCESNRFQDIIIVAFKCEITLKSENQPKKRNRRWRGYTATRQKKETLFSWNKTKMVNYLLNNLMNVWKWMPTL